LNPIISWSYTWLNYNRVTFLYYTKHDPMVTDVGESEMQKNHQQKKPIGIDIFSELGT